MKPYNNGTKRMQGKYGMISITPYKCSDKDVDMLKDKGITLYLTRDLICACDKYLCPVVQNGQIGFINSFAEIVIPPKYDSFIGEFNEVESMIVVYRNNMCGVLNTNGLEILMGEFQSITLINTKYAIVHSNGQYGIIEILSSNMVVPFGEYCSLDRCNDYLVIACQQNKSHKGLISPVGRQITPIKYRWISYVENGLLRVIVENKTDDIVSKSWGVIDMQGHEILPPIYDYISTIKDSKTLYANKDGKSIRFNIANITR